MSDKANTNTAANGKSADPTTDKQTDNPSATSVAANKGVADKAANAASSEADAGAAASIFTQADIDAAEERGRRSAAAEAKRKEKDAQLSESDRLKQRAEEAEARLREREGRDLFERAARDAGGANTAKLYRLVKDEIEYDEQGKPTNLKELVAFAKRDYPEEFGGGHKTAGSADGGAGNKSAASLQPSMNDFIRRLTGRS